MMEEDLLASSSRKNVVVQAWTRMSQIYQGTLDSWTPHAKWRWIGCVVLLAAFTLRIVTKQGYQEMVDKTVPYSKSRWVSAVVLIVLFVVRVLYAQGWYIITYALGIYHLNLFIAFLTPKIDPAMDFDAEDNGPELPTRANEEFRPFIRRLPEFKFWYSVSKSTVIALICTFFECFNIPVFWPILVMYFLTLFCITMKRQIKHMIKYRYLPFTHGKPKYQGFEDVGKVPSGATK